MSAQLRIGIPQPGGRLVAAARDRGLPVLFSANAFARRYPRGHEREGFFRSFGRPDPRQFAGLDAALDSAGFVAMAHYRDFPWTIEQYFDLVEAHDWAFYAAGDHCVEPELAEDRAVRLLRMAATAQNYWACAREAERRGLKGPMPVVQGWTPADYALCIEWLALREWPELVGVGSVCRRPIHGPSGLLEVVEALDQLLPPHTRLHLFGVKGSALAYLANHPRVRSVDSMAWDFQARAARRVGRDIDFRLSHLDAWCKTQGKAMRPEAATAVQRPLFNPAAFGGFSSTEELLLDALALQWAGLVLDGAVDYSSAVYQVQLDATVMLAIVRGGGMSDETLQRLDAEVIPGLAERAEALRSGSAWRFCVGGA